MAAKEDALTLMGGIDTDCDALILNLSLTSIVDGISGINEIITILTKMLNNSDIPRPFYDEFARRLTQIKSLNTSTQSSLTAAGVSVTEIKTDNTSAIALVNTLVNP